jgi:hypothetical protein
MKFGLFLTMPNIQTQLNNVMWLEAEKRVVYNPQINESEIGRGWCILRHLMNCMAFVRATSQYGQRSRGHQFASIRLQETKNLAFWPFTLEAKVQRPSQFNMLYFLTKTTDSQITFGSEDIAFGGFTLWPSKSRGWRSSWPKVWTLSLAFGGLHYARPNAPLTIFYYLCSFSPFLWTLNKVWPFNPMASQLGRP